MADCNDITTVAPPGGIDVDLLAAFWERVVAATGIDPARPQPPSWCFGDSRELADELIELVLGGPKRATAGSMAEYEAGGDPLPRVGELSIVTDGSMRPRALLETTDVRVGPLSSVDDQFAWDEGEGDRTRAWWIDAHTRYFVRAFTRMGLEFHPDILVVFERFTVCYQED